MPEIPQRLQTLFTDWKDFRPGIHLLPLRSFLEALEATEGITELHKEISAEILPRHGRLLHRDGHQTPIVSHALSPDGRWLATGSWVGDNYEAGGELMVWEVATGRCVNLVRGIEGGVGWPDHPGCIQWSPDGSRLGMAFHTNSVGSFLPFEPDGCPLGNICVTDGWSRPPAWCWGPNSHRIMVSCWGGASPIPGCIAEADAGDEYGAGVSWFAAEIPDSVVPHDEEKLELQPFREVHWSRDGKLIYGHNDHGQAYAIDAESGEMRWFSDVGAPVVWDPDDEHFAHNLAGLLFYETVTGLPTFQLPMIVGVTQAYWSPVPGQQRLAALVTEGNSFGADPGVHLYEGREYLGTIPSPPRPISYGDGADSCSWAWSPDGHHGALLTGNKRVEIWRIGGTPELKGKIKLNARITAVCWGVENTLVALGPDLLEFYDIGSKRRKSRYDLRLPSGMTRPSPYTSPLVAVDPLFPDEYTAPPAASVLHEGRQHWVYAFEDGKVVCPPELGPVLEEELCYTIAGRYAWPLRWTDTPVVPDLVAAARTWDLPYDLSLLDNGPAQARWGDFFRACSVDQPEEPWDRSDFENIVEQAESREYWLPTQELGAYQAPAVYQGAEITEANLRGQLLGKCILYAVDFDPNRVQAGALLGLDDDSAFIVYHDAHTLGSSWCAFNSLVYIGEAEPR